MANIKLEDVLEGNHLSPFTLAEFENHLVHFQHSVENLYFYFWLVDYTNRYRRWQASSSNNSEETVVVKVEGSNITTTNSSSSGNKKSNEADGRRRSSVELIQDAILEFFGKKRNSSTDQRVINNQEDLIHSSWISSTASLSYWKPPPNDLDHVLPLDLIKSFLILKSFIIRPTHNNTNTNNNNNHDNNNNSKSCRDQSLAILFSSESFELNISQELGHQFSDLAKISYDPHIFSDIKSEVLHMLSDSLNTWILDLSSSGNTFQKSSQWTIWIGLICVGLAIISTVMIEINKTSWRTGLILTPIFWIGIETIICAIYGTCPIIFIFGKVHLMKLSRVEEAARITQKKLISEAEQFYRFNQPNGHQLAREMDKNKLIIEEKFTPIAHHHHTLSTTIDSKLGTNESDFGPRFHDSTHPSSLIDFWDSKLEEKSSPKLNQRSQFLTCDLQENDRNSSDNTSILMNEMDLTTTHHHHHQGQLTQAVHLTDLKICCNSPGEGDLMVNCPNMTNQQQQQLILTQLPPPARSSSKASSSSCTRLTRPISIYNRRIYQVKSFCCASLLTLIWIFCFSFLLPCLI